MKTIFAVAVALERSNRTAFYYITELFDQFAFSATAFRINGDDGNLEQFR